VILYVGVFQKFSLWVSSKGLKLQSCDPVRRNRKRSQHQEESIHAHTFNFNREKHEKVHLLVTTLKNSLNPRSHFFFAFAVAPPFSSSNSKKGGGCTAFKALLVINASRSCCGLDDCLEMSVHEEGVVHPGIRVDPLGCRDGNIEVFLLEA
jgi:hypothetical protein